MEVFNYHRKIQKQTNNIVDQHGFNHGAFSCEFKNLNFLDIKKVWNKKTPKWFKKFRLKEWQAFQLWHKEHFVFGAIYNAKIVGVSIVSYYNFKTGFKQHSIKTTLPFAQKVAWGLNNSRSKNNEIEIKNEIELNRFTIKIDDRPNDLNLNINAFHITEPHVCCIPFGKNRAMYSHKALMPCSGNLKIGNTTINIGRNDSLLILDDHKGFYPYKLKYNWATGAWRKSDGEFYAFNLTENQSIDSENFNENCFWVNGILQVLPPVKFNFLSGKWIITDAYGMVNLEFTIKSENTLKSNFGLIKANYKAPYGVFNGVIKNTKHTIRLNNVYGMGEIKRYSM
ncbi:MAG: DUF2804 domain-containing protein [Salinivirgaceae bacterium]|nr:DUF2804 domain-containing protein [Salinivirgaceae bacterium]